MLYYNITATLICAPLWLRDVPRLLTASYPDLMNENDRTLFYRPVAANLGDLTWLWSQKPTLGSDWEVANTSNTLLCYVMTIINTNIIGSYVSDLRELKRGGEHR